MSKPMTASSPERPTERAFRATLLHTPVRGELELLPDALLIAGADGAIKAVHRAGSADHTAALARFAAQGQLIELGAGCYLLPGLVDLHVHAPQWPQLGKALDLPLEEWLQTYTFPLESRFSDGEFARTVYESLIDALLANGTTCALYFATLHLSATRVLADICLQRGQRALIGRVAMDHPDQCPPFYRDPSAQVAIRETREFIDYVRALPGNSAAGQGGPRIWPVITPRFIPSCTDELLQGLGDLAAEAKCHIQTHCSESDWEHRYVQGRCGVSDTRALERYGLLSRHTILAHGNFVGDDDVAALIQHGTGIAHCPLSNMYFSDAVLPLRQLLEKGVHGGLGTDISGGASPSILENARHAILASRLLESGVNPALDRLLRRREGSGIDAPTALWLATAGGGIALDLPIGIFKAGYQFDAMELDANIGSSNLRIDPADPAEVLAQKIIHHASRANVRAVWVGNRLVAGAARGGQSR